MWCLILLLIATSAIAQPVWGPYVVHNADSTIQDVELCVRGDTADIVLVTDESVSVHISHNMDSQQNSEPVSLVLNETLRFRYLADMTAVSSQQWVCLLHQNSRTHWGYGTFHFSTEILYGNSVEFSLLNVETSSYIDAPVFHSGSWTESHSLSWNNNRIGIAYVVADIGPFDVGYGWVYHEFDDSLNSLFNEFNLLGSTYNDPYNRAIGIPLPGDSLLYFSEFGFAGGDNFFLGPISDLWENSHYSFVRCGDSGLLRAMYVTPHGRIIATFIDNSLKQLIPGNEHEVECSTFASLPTDWSPSWAFHPSFGFAALQVTPGALLLARIDTAGQEVQPVGVLYETDGPPFIVDADVTITDDGKVVAVWSEYTDWNEGPHSLKIAWTEWTTFLDTEDQSSPVIPTDLSLSSYPNPFNSTVTIKYDLPVSADVRLDVFDIQGRLAATLFNNFASAGSHSVSWSPEHLASGVYFARLTSSDVQVTHKLLYMK